MGVKKRTKGQKASKFPEETQSIEFSENPFLIFNEGPGKPSLRKSYLFHRRESLICLIEPVWHEFGWELKCARTIEQVHQAFQLIAAHMSPGPLAPMLRGTSEPATKMSVESIRAMHVLAAEKSRSLSEAHQAQLQIYLECQRTTNILSEDFEKGLKEELARRKETIRTIKIHISNQKGKIRKAQLQQDDKSSATKLSIPALELELKRFENDRAADEDVCHSLKKRIGSITKEARKVVSEETERQKRKLDSLDQEVRKADLECRKLELKLLDQEAFYFQSQLLDFKRDADYEFTPRNVANALAGLPYITSRRSAELCSGMESKIAPSMNYDVLKFIASVWNRREKRAKLSIIDWFKLQIRRLPKTKIIKGEKKEYYFRTWMAKRWFFLRLTLERLHRSKLHPSAVPYTIAREFRKHSLNPESPADSILAKNNKITD